MLHGPGTAPHSVGRGRSDDARPMYNFSGGVHLCSPADFEALSKQFADLSTPGIRLD